MESVKNSKSVVSEKGLDVAYHKEKQREAEQGGFKSDVIYQSSIKDGDDIIVRLLPQPACSPFSQSYYMELLTYTLNKKRFISPVSLNVGAETSHKCPIAAEIQEAYKQKGKASVDLMLKESSYQVYQYRKEFAIVVLKYDIEENASEEGFGYKLVDDDPFLFICNNNVYKHINSLTVSKASVLQSKKNKWGVLGRELGRMITISRTGTGLSTEYSVQKADESYEIPQSDFDKTFSIYDRTKAYMKSEGCMRKAIREVLWDEPGPTEDDFKARMFESEDTSTEVASEDKAEDIPF